MVVDDNGHRKLGALLVGELGIVDDDRGHRAFVAPVANPAGYDFPSLRVEYRRQGSAAHRQKLVGFVGPATRKLDDLRELWNAISTSALLTCYSPQNSSDEYELPEPSTHR